MRHLLTAIAADDAPCLDCVSRCYDAKDLTAVHFVGCDDVNCLCDYAVAADDGVTDDC